MKLTDEQIKVLEKVAKRTKMDAWFYVDKNGYIHNKHNHSRFVSVQAAVNALNLPFKEKIVSYASCRLTKKDIKIFESLIETVNTATK